MMNQGKSLPHSFIRASILFLTALALSNPFSTAVYAAEKEFEGNGKIYEFGGDSHYEFHTDNDNSLAAENETYGKFVINGDFTEMGKKEGVPSYKVQDGGLDLFYNYEKDRFGSDLDSWHLTEDKSKKIADSSFRSDIRKGAILVQTSKDRKSWSNVCEITNAFGDNPSRKDPVYTTTDIELINGSFYRLSVVYETRIRTEERPSVIPDKFDYKKHAEVYEFHAYSDAGKAADSDEIDMSQTYNLGEKKRVKEFKGYYGEQDIDNKDVHYGWELGKFFVSGYTDKVNSQGVDKVFLKNVGDKVTLWFRLDQDINRINGNDNLTVSPDREGFDRAFETPRMDFGRGTLIIRYTDPNNVKSDPIIYTNFLEANAQTGAKTQVRLFEEGDYEVALDYEIKRDELLDKTGRYRNSFKFSVRNGNCMVYPFDVQTGSELTNSSVTENGFRLDLAKSRYLKINLKREKLNESVDGLVEETRLNGPAKEGAEYTEEGIYTITARNEYTGQSTVKKIYVGSNKLLKASVKTGLSIPEIKERLKQGDRIAEDGTIVSSERSTSSGTTTSKTNSRTSESSVKQDKDEQNTSTSSAESKTGINKTSPDKDGKNVSGGASR